MVGFQAFHALMASLPAKSDSDVINTLHLIPDFNDFTEAQLTKLCEAVCDKLFSVAFIEKCLQAPASPLDNSFLLEPLFFTREDPELNMILQMKSFDPIGAVQGLPESTMKDRLLRKAFELNEAHAFKLFQGPEQFYDPAQWIPRERYIKAKLKRFLEALALPQDFSIQAYIGVSRPESFKKVGTVDRKRLMAASELAEMELFSLPLVPDMKNGHVRLPNDKLIQRCLTLHTQDTIVGGIYFHVDYEQNSAYVHRLEVKKPYRGQQFGSYLLQSALYIATLYGCRLTSLHPDYSAIPFYEKHGFKFDVLTELMILDLNVRQSRSAFLDAMEKSAPSYYHEVNDALTRIETSYMRSNPKNVLLNYKSASAHFEKSKIEIAEEPCLKRSRPKTGSFL